MALPTRRVSILATAAALLLPTASVACSVTGIDAPESLVARADVIVRARADSYRDNNQGEPRFQDLQGRVYFRVIATLKGSTGEFVNVPGVFGPPRDDFNDRPVPYNFVRPAGRGGNCFAVTYRQGAEYVLLLRRNTSADKSGDLSPYWEALAPTNEQVTGADDPWVQWIADQIKRRSVIDRPYPSPASRH